MIVVDNEFVLDDGRVGKLSTSSMARLLALLENELAQQTRVERAVNTVIGALRRWLTD